MSLRQRAYGFADGASALAGGAAPATGPDLRRPQAPSQLVQAGRRSAWPGGCAVLVSNSGLNHLQPLQDIIAAQFDEMLAVNLRAPFLLAHCAAGPCGNR